MSNFSIDSSGPVDPSRLGSEKAEAKKAVESEMIELISADVSAEQWAQEGFNPLAMSRRFKTLDEQKPKLAKSEKEEGATQKKVTEVKAKDELAQYFQQKNSELQSKTLIILRQRLAKDDTSEDILRKVLDIYPDYTLADEALDYLAQTSSGSLKTNILRAREALNNYYKREIVAGKNIATEAKTFSQEGLGSPTALRDMYRDITGNPRTPHTLFDELSEQFGFDKLSKVVDFLLHSMGSDLKAKGPSISRAELKRLIDDIRSLQAILGVYVFFRSRMSLMRGQFDKYEMMYPEDISFEILARKFMELLKERYISPERIYQLARKLNISNDLVTQIILFTQMRDGVRGIATRLYRDDKHRQEVLQALMEALEELEDQLIEEEENDE